MRGGLRSTLDIPWEEVRGCTTTGGEGVEVELEITGMGPVEVHLWDASAGLPRPGGALLSARPSWAVPFNTGDRTVVLAKTTL